MTSTATLNFVVPVQSVELGLISRSLAFPSRSFALTVDRVAAEALGEVSLSEVEWPYSDSLGGHFSYVGGCDAPGQVARCMRTLVFEGMRSVTLTVKPWGARKDPLLKGIQWHAVVGRAVPAHAPTGDVLFALARLEGGQ